MIPYKINTLSFMENDEVKVDEIEGDEALGTEPLDENTDWKAEALKARGIAKRNATRLERLKKAATTKVETVSPPDKKIEKVEKTEFDYAEKAFLRASGIESVDYTLVWEAMKQTGKTLDEVLGFKYFQAELKEVREARATKDAIPSGSKRSTPSTRDTVDYWIAKGELPPPDQIQLRRDVVNEKLKREQDRNQFAPRSVV